MMENAKAVDAGRQCRPGVEDHPQPIIPYPQPPQALQPTDRPLQRPLHLPQVAAVWRLPLSGVRLDRQTLDGLDFSSSHSTAVATAPTDVLGSNGLRPVSRNSVVGLSWAAVKPGGLRRPG
jgi:hypothetical protein